MLSKYYPEFVIEEDPEEGYDLTISFNLENIPKISKKKSGLS